MVTKCQGDLKFNRTAAERHSFLFKIKCAKDSFLINKGLGDDVCAPFASSSLIVSDSVFVKVNQNNYKY